jgi:type II secretory pathway pseudopilin PulG
MKLPSVHASPPRCRQAGSAVIVVMALLAIILVYVASNLRTLNSLGRELKLLERQQTRRLQTAVRATNSPPAITVATNTVPTPPAN